ncbi:hypothetical protein EG878_14720 [Enterococcus faecalis]|nr:hypothetical protein EG878_14720 [Enterococcus faecalis]
MALGKNEKQMVRVYRNLNKKCISVQSTKSNLVIAHSQAVSLTDCTFVVRQKGRERVLREKRKNVHAFIKGSIDPDYVEPPLMDRPFIRMATYNPYEAPHFYDVITKQPVFKASRAWVLSDGTIFYREDETE